MKIVIKRKLFTKCYEKKYDSLVESKLSDWINSVYQCIRKSKWEIVDKIPIDAYRDGFCVRDIEEIDPNNKINATLKITIKVKSSTLSKYLPEDYCWNVFLNDENEIVGVNFAGRFFN